MDKKRMLVASCKTISSMLALFVLLSCSLPGILMLRDQMTPEEHINLGIAYERNRELDEALREYMIAVKRLPIAYLYMGNVYVQKDAVGDAERCYNKAINKTKDPRAYNNLAWLYYSEDMKLDIAEKLACKAVEISPDAQDFKDTLEKIIVEDLNLRLCALECPFDFTDRVGAADR